MQGYELQQARQLRRTELRRAASGVGFGSSNFLVLDAHELCQRADLGDVGAQGNAVKRWLVLDALARQNVPDAQIAAAWNVSEALLASWKQGPLLDRTGIAAAIDQQVLDELPETPEPGRYVAPHV